MDICERGQHVGLVGDVEAEGADQEGRAASSSEEEDDAVAWSFHVTVLSGKLRQAICLVTDREVGGCLLLDDQCTKTRRPVAEFLREKHPVMCVPLWKNPRAQPLRSMRIYPKRYPLSSRRMTSHESHQSSLAQQVRW